MRQNNTSALAHSPACGKWTQTRRIFFPRHFQPRFSKCFHILKGFKAFQSSRNWFKYSEKQIGFNQSWEFVQPSLAFNFFARETVTFCTKQEMASISITWNRGKSSDIHTYLHTYIHTYKLTYIRISEIKLVLTKETQAGHVLDRN